MESRRIPALSHVSKANIFMTSGPEKSINPLVADVGSPPIPEAQGWTTRYDGAFGPLINLSQAVPGNRAPCRAARAHGRQRRRAAGCAIRADQRRCASPAGLCGRAFPDLRGPDRAGGHGDHGGLQHGLLRHHDAARPSRRRGAAADALVFQPPDEPRHARHRAAPAALPGGCRIRAARRGCGGADRRQGRAPSSW